MNIKLISYIYYGEWIYKTKDRGIISQFTIEISEEDIILLENLRKILKAITLSRKRTEVRDTEYVSRSCSITFLTTCAQTIAEWSYSK